MANYNKPYYPKREKGKVEQWFDESFEGCMLGGMGTRHYHYKHPVRANLITIVVVGGLFMLLGWLLG